MTLQDLTDNKSRIISKIKFQITKATNDNIKSVMIKMVAMLPLYENQKATKANIDNLTIKAITSYIKHDHKHTSEQSNTIDDTLFSKRMSSRPSSL